MRKYAESYGMPTEDTVHDWFEVSYNHKKLMVQMFTPHSWKNNVLFIHGFFDHSGTHAETIQFLVKKGFRVTVFDLPGHGLSGGARFQIDHFKHYQGSLLAVLDWLQDNGVTSTHAVGHSTGGAILAENLLTRKREKHFFDEVCLIAPLLRSNQWWVSKIFTSLLSPFFDKIPRKFPREPSAKLFIKEVRKDPLQGQFLHLTWVEAMFQWEEELSNQIPVEDNILILQGVNDSTVDWKHNMEEYGRLFPKARRIMIDNGTHYLLNGNLARKKIVYYLLLKQFSKHNESMK